MQQLKIAIVASGLLVILEFYHFVRTHFSFEQYFHDSIAFTNYIRESNGNQNWLSLMRNRVETDPITNIRSWGCNLTESPVTFIHIGKSGGGTCRPKFQSLRNDYGYVNALYPFFYTDPNYTDSRRVIDCDAVTPLGNAIGCPVPMQLSTKSKLCSLESDTCHKSYVGHNFLGNEIHWLPPKILLSWWNTTFYFTKEETKRNATVIKRHLKSLIPPNIWCIDEKSSRPQNRKAYMKSYSSCVQPLQSMIDETSLKMFIDELKPSKHKSLGNMDWSPLYASLPVLRTTIIREPFSWLVSKFFWEVREEDHKPRCEEIDFATTHTQDGHFHFHNTVGDGWASRFALKYLFYLCGEDCPNRYTKGISEIKDLEKQAEGNLRQSIAVVGLLEDMDTFFNMVSDRIAYLDPNEIEGGSRHSVKSALKVQCSSKFQEPDFQNELMKRSEAIAAIARLYIVAKEVNEFQIEELSECKADKTKASVSW